MTFVPIPELPGYGYNFENKTVRSLTSGIDIFFDERDSQRHFWFCKNGKCYTFSDLQLERLATNNKTKDVPGTPIREFPNYTITRDGRIFNRKTGQEKKTLQTRHGRRVKFPGVKSETKSIHRLLAQTYIPNPDNLPIVNHKNGNRLDNRLENLEWIRNVNGDYIKILQIDVVKCFGEERFYSNLNEASRETRICPDTIYVAYKKEEIVGGFLWTYDIETKRVKSTEVLTKAKIVREYDSLEEAAEANDTTPKKIASCLSNTGLVAGYGWKLANQKNVGWRKIPNFSRYVISRDGRIFAARQKQELYAMHRGKIILRRDDGTVQKLYPKVLAAETFA